MVQFWLELQTETWIYKLLIVIYVSGLMNKIHNFNWICCSVSILGYFMDWRPQSDAESVHCPILILTSAKEWESEYVTSQSLWLLGCKAEGVRKVAIWCHLLYWMKENESVISPDASMTGIKEPAGLFIHKYAKYVKNWISMTMENFLIDLLNNSIDHNHLDTKQAQRDF